jgi:excisionase family DNA binding protein
MPETEGEYLTVKAACELLGVSPNTLRSWGAAGKVTEYRHPVNNYRLFRRIELETLRERLRHPDRRLRRRSK